MNEPLISSPVPLLVIRQEYQSGSAQVLKKLDYLQSQGWDQVWRARGDGDCFYRCELPTLISYQTILQVDSLAHNQHSQ